MGEENERVGKISLSTNSLFLFIHIIFIIMFCLFGIKLMILVNMVSIAVYLYTYSLIARQKYFQQIVITYIEVMLYMAFATIVLGWECYFEFYTISFMLIIYYLSFSIEQIKPRLVSAVLAFLFCAMRIATFFYEPLYRLDEAVILLIGSINIIILIALLIGWTELYARDVKQHMQKLRERADLDELSNIYNRHRLNEILKNWYEEATIDYKYFSVAILDIDDFKHINDTYGHSCGDYVIRKISMTLKEMSSEDIIVGRWGGEEFLIIQKHMNDFKDNCLKLRELSETIRNMEFRCDRKKFNVTVTIGISDFNSKGTLDEMLQEADGKLYHGKSHGKNTVSY